MADDALIPPGIADDRTRALVALTDRLLNIDRSILFVYRFDTVPSAALYALAWQFDVTGFAGWNFPTTDDQRRALLRSAIDLHRHRGTASAIIRALEAIGWPAVDVVEPQAQFRHDGSFAHDGSARRGIGASWTNNGIIVRDGRARHDGGFRHDGTRQHYPDGAWAKFAVVLGQLGDPQGLEAGAADTQRQIIGAWKNARSELVEMMVSLPGIVDGYSLADAPMPFELTTYHRHDGTYQHNGTIDHSGSDSVLEAAI